MSIKVTCPDCKKQIKAPDAYAVTSAKCPGCGTAVQFPGPDDARVDFGAPTEKQLAFAACLGIATPDGADRRELSKPIGVAKVQKQKDDNHQLEESEVLANASYGRVLGELVERNRPFIISLLDDAELRYKAATPIKGNLGWANDIYEDDVKYILARLFNAWCKSLDMDAYADEYDGNLPDLEGTGGQLEVDDWGNVIDVEF